MAKQEFLMLAHVYKDQPVNGWFMSEKLDGIRALWDGGITRGMPCSEVPFANTAKDRIRITPPTATGLWTRYGKAVQAPDWFLDSLPPYPLDGELYGGRGNFQITSSIVRTIDPRKVEWDRIQYVVFDSPPYHALFANRTIDNKPHFVKRFDDIYRKLGQPDHPNKTGWTFRSVYQWLQRQREENWGETDRVVIHQQLPVSSNDQLREALDNTLERGGEGLMLRHPTSYWVTQRSKTLLKVKGENDDEGTVVGYVWGRETDRGSKLLGLMGALVLEWQGQRFELSGFTEDERKMCYITGTDGYSQARLLGERNPGMPVIDTVHNPKFPIGSRITFKYRELTDKGIPKEARYLRRRDEL